MRKDWENYSIFRLEQETYGFLAHLPFYIVKEGWEGNHLVPSVMYIMRKSYTLSNLQEWENNPINVGSFYVKPTKDAEYNICGWFCYICCCGCILK